MDLNNFFANFGLNFLLRWFLPFLFLGQTIFLLIVGRQISLMSNLFRTKMDFLLKAVNWILLALAVLGLLISLLTVI
ncbi:MAG: hypothetical protein XD98_0386 [Microgenomates bacterium 39_6]|nr:MAG: hypothetical protein XD98_0386 [Microgenomates bacterium 39_6]